VVESSSTIDVDGSYQGHQRIVNGVSSNQVFAEPATHRCESTQMMCASICWLARISVYAVRLSRVTPKKRRYSHESNSGTERDGNLTLATHPDGNSLFVCVANWHVS